jgi:radical SAM superfamily enzyme YgiQ (UPF0313 family)
MAYLMAHAAYGRAFEAHSVSINLYPLGGRATMADIDKGLLGLCVSEFTDIAIGAYVWSEYLTNPLIRHLRQLHGFKGNVILGGYQISYADHAQLEKEYPDCQYFIRGHAEDALLRLLLSPSYIKGIISCDVPFESLPSPYLTGAFPIAFRQEMVRMETQRGCPYKCSFCAHRDLKKGEVYRLPTQKAYEELAYFHERQVGKINMLDPIFNAGPTYIPCLEEMVRLGLKATVSLQCRFETIAGPQGERFLDLCEQLNVHLEFGLQTAIREESALIDRKNNMEKVASAMAKLRVRQIPYEVSLIYGLPIQTLSSFQRSIDFVMAQGCTHITAFPLMLLKGTKLFGQKEFYGYREALLGEYQIPVAIASNTYSEADWQQMERIAQELPSPKKYIRI